MTQHTLMHKSTHTHTHKHTHTPASRMPCTTPATKEAQFKCPYSGQDVCAPTMSAVVSRARRGARYRRCASAFVCVCVCVRARACVSKFASVCACARASSWCARAYRGSTFGHRNVGIDKGLALVDHVCAAHAPTISASCRPTTPWAEYPVASFTAGSGEAAGSVLLHAERCVLRVCGKDF